MFMNKKEGLILALPAALFATLLFLLPVMILLSEAFRIDGSWSLQGYVDFFAKPLNQVVFLRTLKLGVLVAGTAAVIGYAAAFCIVNLPAKSRGRVFGLVVLPLMISPVARTYAWIVILGRTGIVNDVILGLGLSDTPLRLLFTETAVFLGLLQLFLPLMIISLVSAMENIPRDVIPAARVLGEALTTGQSVTDVEDWPNRIAAVTVDQVNAAARAVLNDDASATGLLLPAAQEVRQ